jgi:hypothetical protein
MSGLICLALQITQCLSLLKIHASGISPAENTRLAAISKLGAKTPSVSINHKSLRLKMPTIPANLFHVVSRSKFCRKIMVGQRKSFIFAPLPAVTLVWKLLLRLLLPPAGLAQNFSLNTKTS